MLHKRVTHGVHSKNRMSYIYIYTTFMWLPFKFWCQTVKANEVHKTVKHIDIVIYYHVFITHNSINHTKEYILSTENL